MSFIIFPYIWSFDIKYNFPKDLKVEPITIDSAIVVNYGKGSMKKLIEFVRSKEFQRIWQNEKS
jgi:ABC-type molybdate transport system substrate-binding protein